MFKRILLILFMLIGFGVFGCVVTGRNQLETGLRLGQEFTWFHRTAQTADVDSELNASTSLIDGALIGGENETPETP